MKEKRNKMMTAKYSNEMMKNLIFSQIRKHIFETC